MHVAVGVIAMDGEILVAKRAAGQHQGELWEFPGGKLEPGETVEHALARELEEELAIRVARAAPFMVVEHDYHDKQVLLDVWLVTAFSGKPMAMESQPLAWVSPGALSEYAFPEANQPIVEKVQSAGIT